MSKKVTKEEFISRAIDVHGERYDYSDVLYINNKTKIKIKCPLHGVFEQKPYSHLSGNGCKECSDESKTMTQEEFIKKSIDIHGVKYGYDDVIFINSICKVKIKCYIHGVFEQRASDHLIGSGCIKCNKNGITKERFISIGKDKKCTFYIIRCFNNNESFYKIGITTQKLKYRLSGKSRIPYDYTILKEIKDYAGTVWDIENHLKENLKSVYTPWIPFGGYVAECFSDLKEIENNLQNIL